MSALSHYDLGFEAYEKGDFSQAIFHFEKARQDAPADFQLLTQLCNALKCVGQFDKAVEIHESLPLALLNDPEVISNLATTYLESGKIEDAISHLSRAVKRRPQDPQLLFELAIAFEGHRDFEQAIRCDEQVINLAPRHHRALTHLGSCYKYLGDFEKAIAAQTRAVEIAPRHPDANWNLALTELLLGRYETGFARYEFRRQTKGFLNLGGCLWDGQPFDGVLVVHTEQGLGSTFQFIRYLPLLKSKVAHVTLMCQPALVPFLRNAFASDIEICPIRQVNKTQQVAPLLSLPFLLHRTIPYADNIPYLSNDSQRVDYWKKIFNTDNRLKVGLCWQGHPHHKDDADRSIPLHRLSPLFSNREVRFFSLQKTHGVEQLSELSTQFKIIELGSVLDEEGAFIDTADVISVMDLVITVDTAIAHLSGALGCETWTLLPCLPNFSWGLENHCPYYPKTRLFRQPLRGDWTTVVHELNNALLDKVLPARYWP